MKVNREVSDLARKLDYIGINAKKRRKIIKYCLNSVDKFLFGTNSTINKINESYNFIKNEMDGLEKQRREYEKLDRENKKYSRDIMYIKLQN